LYPGQSAQSLARDLATLRESKGFNGEWQGRHKDGSLHWVTLKTTLLRDPAGEPIGYISVSTDITQRKQAERRLEAQYAVTRILSESESIAGASPKILEEICQTVGWQVGVIWCVDNAADVLRCVGLWRAPGLDIREFERLTREMLFPIGVGLPGRVWESRTLQWIKDVASDINFPRAKVAAKNNLHSAMGFPIVTGDQFTGVIEFLSSQTRPPDSALTEMLHSLASQIGQFIERKQAEEALRLSEEQHSIILQGVADGITAQDPEGRLIYANIAAARLIGYPSPEELLKAPIAQVIEKFKIMDTEGHPIPPERLPGRVAMITKEPANDQLHFTVLESGEESWSQVNAAPILDEQGNVQFVINIFHDVTEQRRAETAVREQRELLQVTLSSIGDAVMSTDAHGNIRFMNPVAEALTGWKMEEAAGKPLAQVFEIISEETGEPVPSPFGRVMHDQAVVGLTNHTMLVTHSGERVPIDDSGAPIRDAGGNIIGVVLVFRDITERRKTEREISRLATIVKSSEDAIISQRLDGTVLTWNPGAERLYGYVAEEIIGRPITLTYPPERLYEYEDIIARLIRGELIDHFDTVRLTKDGRRLDVSISVALLRDAEGQIRGVSKIARDITDQKRAEKVTRFLAEASDVLVSSLDYETTLASVARLIVPEIADWCAVDILDKDGALKRLALEHVDPTKLELANELQRRYPGDLNANYGVHNVIRTGKPEINPVIDDEMIARSAHDVDHLRLLTEIGFSSSMTVPLIARNRTLGAMTFVLSESRRHFGSADLALVQDLARRVALAVDNARLYREAQEMNEELEHRVVSRTIELQNTNAKLQAEISERQRANDQLRLLSGHLEKAREEERIRIAREIHDEIGQVLTAIKMDLSMLGRELVEGRPGDDRQAEIESTTRLVDDAIQTMHHIVRELRPEVLDHLDLRSALEWQVQEFQSRTRIESRFDSELDELDLDPERSTALFRILQETLTNVARHAQATHVQATLKKLDGQLVMQVQDDGIGISDDRVTNSQTFGILGMRERARALGGDVDIASLPDHGTTVTVHIPV
ncbi:MAG TPA: PAS domain S-box protein, partial [Anaerolineae bacterium]